jgi:hypothetical protein
MSAIHPTLHKPILGRPFTELRPLLQMEVELLHVLSGKARAAASSFSLASGGFSSKSSAFMLPRSLSRMFLKLTNDDKYGGSIGEFDLVCVLQWLLHRKD